MLEIKKNNHHFSVIGAYSENWFSNNKLDKWEQDTFYILDHYSNIQNGIYIDIGAWIGPTVLYSAHIYNKIIAIEPDPVAFHMLEENCKINNFNNITLVKKALADKNGISKFGGNGGLGNSESTLLVSKDDFFTYDGRHQTLDQSSIVNVETIKIETLLSELKLNGKDISLMKMDIEGGEIILIPYLKKFLETYKPNFFISLHYVYLRKSDIKLIVEILFEIYDKCFVFNFYNGKKQMVTKKEVLEKELHYLVFESIH